MRTTPRTLGLLGGMSWESSIEYERILNAETRSRLGGTSSADLVIRSYNFAQIEQLQATGQWDQAGRLLAADARMLETAGAEAVLLCTNTMHVLAPQIEAAIDIPLLHLADATADAILNTFSLGTAAFNTAAFNTASPTEQSPDRADPNSAGHVSADLSSTDLSGTDPSSTDPGSTDPSEAASHRTVALLGTRYTMEQDFYRGRLEARGLNVLIPNEADRTTIHDVIYNELVQGQIRAQSKAAYLEIIARLQHRGATGIIAGCTEIELLVNQDDLTIPYFPTAKIHALHAVDWSLR